MLCACGPTCFRACEPGPPSPPWAGPIPLLPGIAVELDARLRALPPLVPPVQRSDSAGGPSSWENVTGCLFVRSLLSTQGVLAHETSPSTLFWWRAYRRSIFLHCFRPSCLSFLPPRRAVHQAPSQICVRGRVQLPYLITFPVSVAEHEPSFSFSQHFLGVAPRQHGQENKSTPGEEE